MASKNRTRRTAHPRNQIPIRWKFALGCAGLAIACAFFIAVVFLGPSDWAPYKNSVIGILLATCVAGFACFAREGYLWLRYEGSIDGHGSFALSAYGAFAAFIIVLFVWFYFTPIFNAYQVTLYLRDDQGNPVTEADIYPELKETDVKKSGGSWEIIVPYYNKPDNGRFRVIATNRERYLRGEAEVGLEGSSKQSVIINMVRDRSGTLKGTVIDSETGLGIPDATVYAIGNETARYQTGSKGEFEFRVNAAPGERLHVRGEKAGYQGDPIYAMAGFDAVIPLTKNK